MFRCVFCFVDFDVGGVFIVSFVNWDNLEHLDGEMLVGGVSVMGSMKFDSDSYSNTCNST